MHPPQDKPMGRSPSSVRWKAAAWVVLALAAMPALLAVPPPPAAVVADVRGPVTVQRQGTGPLQPVSASLPLHAGDVVRTGKTGRATIYFPNSQPQAMGPNRHFAVPATPLQASNAEPPPWHTLWRALLACLKRSLGGPGTDRPAAVREGREEEGILTVLWPRETRLLEPPDRFIWEPAPGATRYQIVVGFHDTDEKIWQCAVTDPQAPYPPEAPRFQPGCRYFWQVTAFPDEALDSSWFVVVKPEEAKAIREAHAAFRPDEPGADLALASLELENGLVADAIARLQAALQKNPDDALRWRLLRDAYLQASLPLRAQAAAEKMGAVTEAERQGWEQVRPD